MTKEQVLSALNDLMIDVFDDDDLVITSETVAPDVPGWDSQGHIMLIVAVEQRFGIRFRTSEFDSLKNVGEFVELIEAKVEKL